MSKLNFPPVDSDSANPTDGLLWTDPNGRKWMYKASIPGWTPLAEGTNNIIYRGGIDLTQDPDAQYNEIKAGNEFVVTVGADPIDGALYPGLGGDAGQEGAIVRYDGSRWQLVGTDIPYATELAAGVVELADATEALDVTNNRVVLTPRRGAELITELIDEQVPDLPTATTTRAGIVELADSAEALNENINDRALTPQTGRELFDFAFKSKITHVADYGTNTDAILDAIEASDGILVFESGRTYNVTQKLVFKANTTVIGNGATLNSQFSTPNNNTHYGFQAGCVVQNLYFTLGTGYVAHRFVGIGDNSSFDNIRIIAKTQQDRGDDNLDGALQIRGDNVRVTNLEIDKFDRSVYIHDVENVSIDGFRIQRYVKGIKIGGSISNYVTITNGYFRNKSPNATTNPGHNAIGGSAEHITVSNVQIDGSGEHGMYFNAEGWANGQRNVGITINNCLINQPGQCGIKVRGYSQAAVSNCTVLACAYNNSLGTNEDCYRFEACTDASLTNCQGFKGSKSNCGYYGVILNACQDFVVDGCYFENPQDDGVFITDSQPEPVNRIQVLNTTVRDGKYGFGLVTNNTKVSGIFVNNLVSTGPSVAGFRWDANAGKSGENEVWMRILGTDPPNLVEAGTSMPRYKVETFDNPI